MAYTRGISFCSVMIVLLSKNHLAAPLSAVGRESPCASPFLRPTEPEPCHCPASAILPSPRSSACLVWCPAWPEPPLSACPCPRPGHRLFHPHHVPLRGFDIQLRRQHQDRNTLKNNTEVRANWDTTQPAPCFSPHGLAIADTLP